jgi:hypothetical protein
MIAAAVVLLAHGLGVVRTSALGFPADAWRYVNEIEREFEGEAVDRVLLDAGSWVHLKHGVVMKDRAPSIGERATEQIGDFSGILERIGRRHYSKILVRNLHEPDFWYDHQAWRQTTGIRKALLEHYHETRRIAAVSPALDAPLPYLLSEISVLTPRMAGGNAQGALHAR